MNITNKNLNFMNENSDASQIHIQLSLTRIYSTIITTE